MKENGTDEATVKAIEETLNKYRLNKGYHLNAMSPSGDIVTLVIPYTSFLILHRTVIVKIERVYLL